MATLKPSGMLGLELTNVVFQDSAPFIGLRLDQQQFHRAVCGESEVAL